MACGWKPAHVGADLGHDHLRGQLTHAWDRAQQSDRLAERVEAAVHLRVDLSQGGIERIDLPQVQPIFEEYVAAHGLSDRLRFQPGSFFTDPLPQVDVIVMGHVLHDWDLETKKALIKKAYDALPAGGAFIAYEALIDDDRGQLVAPLLISLNMLMETRGGFGYTGVDGQRWMKEAGFRETRVEPLAGLDSMVVGIK